MGVWDPSGKGWGANTLIGKIMSIKKVCSCEHVSDGLYHINVTMRSFEIISNLSAEQEVQEVVHLVLLEVMVTYGG